MTSTARSLNLGGAYAHADTHLGGMALNKTTAKAHLEAEHA